MSVFKNPWKGEGSEPVLLSLDSLPHPSSPVNAVHVLTEPHSGGASGVKPREYGFETPRYSQSWKVSGCRSLEKSGVRLWSIKGGFGGRTVPQKPCHE